MNRREQRREGEIGDVGDRLDGGWRLRFEPTEHGNRELLARRRLDARQALDVLTTRTYDVDEIGAGGGVSVQSAYRFPLVPSVGARDDHQIGVEASGDGGADLRGSLLDGNKLDIARHGRAFLGLGLILEQQARDARRLEFAHRPHHIDGIAVAGVAIRDQRNGGRGDHIARHGENFGGRI